MGKNRKKILKKTFMIMFYILIVIFIVRYFMGLDLSQIKNVKINYIFLVFGTAVRVISLLLLPLSWRTLLNHFSGKKISLEKIYTIYSKSWLGRYIPGKIAWVGGKIYFAIQEEIDANVAVVTSFLDAVLQVFSCMIVGVVFLLFNDVSAINQRTIYVMYGMTAFMLICFIPPVFNRVIRLLYKVLKHQDIGNSYAMTGKTFAGSVGIVVVSKLISGIGTAFVTIAVYSDLSLRSFVFCIGIFSVSTAIGMAALFAPAGLGVKESMQLLLLSLIVPREIGAIVVILASVQAIVIDLLFYVISKAIFKFDSPLQKTKPDQGEKTEEN